MHFAKRVAALLAVANLVALGTVACSVKQTAEKVEQSLDLKYPEKKEEK